MLISESSNKNHQNRKKSVLKTISANIKEINYNISRSFKNSIIYNIFLEHKHRKQRAKRGWADNDLFSIDWWFQNTFVDMLDNFQIRTHGHPQEKFEEVDTFPKGWIKLTLDDIKKETLNYKYNCFTEEDVDKMITNMDDFIKWKLIIKRIIYLLKESNEDECSRKSKYFNLWYDNTFVNENNIFTEEESEQQAKLTQQWMDECKEIDLYREQCAKQAFELLSKYFFNLWD